jgi:hypothetical protein
MKKSSVIKFSILFIMMTAVSLIMGCAPGRSIADYSYSQTDPTQPATSGSESETLLDPDFHPDASIREAVGNIRFDRSIPRADYVLIAKDFHSIRSMTFDHAKSSSVIQVMKLKDASASGVLAWLEDRVKYILDKEGYLYGTSSSPGVQADNYGAMMYALDLKYPGSGFGVVDIHGTGTVIITSPRAGLVRLGPGLFDAEKDLSSHKIAISLSLHRLGTFYHEARHSDGNGRSLTFSHELCPPGHDLADKYACDKSTNGPYTIGALFQKAAMDSCSSCSIMGKSVLKMYIADSLSRVLPGATEWDATPI